ncbi:peroxiredoxin Q/BCP [Seinonella peptonophila]|uniref:thioredoxin-dependent peroxiredoxin n=1 Tax=Seinonella peptonophila TaxID=112248 RepID=A0A1M4ZJ99_9BACL|nr:thioredoxin-dependent thiol peroxidase [Seinonella peptonophila]SHF18150.1 peroxiredoxin Q/BCP [Seinonella peptonophila]
MVKIGSPAPDFTLPATTQQTIQLNQLRGSYVVLYFYPKDLTPGCTLEANDFRIHYDEFQQNHVEILGISRDSVTSHEKFVEKCQLPFALLSDEDGSVCNLYDVMKEKNMFGKKVMGIERSTFLIDPDGVIVKAYRKVKAKGHVEEILSFLKEYIK